MIRSVCSIVVRRLLLFYLSARLTPWIYQQIAHLEDPRAVPHAHSVPDIRADLRVPHVPLVHPLVSVAVLRMSSLRAGYADDGNR